MKATLIWDAKNKEVCVKVGNTTKTTRVTMGVCDWVKRFKQITISTTKMPGSYLWRTYNNEFNSIYIQNSHGSKRFCKRGIWKLGLKLPKQDHVWVKYGK